MAIGLVLFSHSVIYDEFTGLRSSGFEAGNVGVTIFFVLSGYLITTLLLREEDKAGSISLWRFYLRRALRLFPALWLYLSVVAAIRSAGGLPDQPWSGIWASLFYIRNLTGSGFETDHLWSLSLEEQFYLVWPLALVGLPRRDRFRLAIALCGVAAITAWRGYAAKYGLVSFRALSSRSDFRFDAPLWGGVLALMQRVWPAGVKWANSSAARSSIAAAVGLAALFGWVVCGLDRLIPFVVRPTVVCLLGIPLILSQVGVQGRVSRVLGWTPLVVVGQLSYSVYLWQELFVGPLVPGFESVRTFPVGLTATFAVAVASYRLVERPLVRLKDRTLHSSVPEAKNGTPSGGQVLGVTVNK